MLRLYAENLIGPAPEFPREIEAGIDGYLVRLAMLPTAEAKVSEERASDLDDYLVGGETASGEAGPDRP